MGGFRIPWYKLHYDESLPEILDGIEWMFSEGNYACDCNIRLFLGGEEEDIKCGETDPYSVDTLIFEDLEGKLHTIWPVKA